MPMPERAPAGCLAAVAAAAALPALVTMTPLLLFLTLPVAGVHALLFALPLYRVLSWNRRPGAGVTLASAFLVGALPALLLVLLLSPPPLEDAGALLGGAESGPVLWAQLQHWGEYLAAPLIIGGCGLAGGIAFWLVAGRDKEA